MPVVLKICQNVTLLPWQLVKLLLRPNHNRTILWDLRSVYFATKVEHGISYVSGSHNYLIQGPVKQQLGYPWDLCHVCPTLQTANNSLEVLLLTHLLTQKGTRSWTCVCASVIKHYAMQTLLVAFTSDTENGWLQNKEINFINIGVPSIYELN